MNGTLYICGTPIGNLEDITYRIIRTLKESDYIVCEDTRHTLRLLNYFEIDSKGKLISYHEHNKLSKAEYIVSLLKDGNNIALVSDAGMPFISDPGLELVTLCYENDITVTTVPSATAFVSGLILSAIPSPSFTFMGFLSPNNKKRNSELELIRDSVHTVILYEAPHHIKKTLKDLDKFLDNSNRKISILREITKKFEENISGTTSELIAYFDENEPRGEMVVVIEGKSHDEIIKDNIKKWDNMSIEDHVKMYEDEGLSQKDAIKKVAKDRNEPKKTIYAKIHID